MPVDGKSSARGLTGPRRAIPAGLDGDRRDEAAGERIRSARRSRGLTQDQFAQAMGVSRSAVAQWETGRSGYNGKLRRIADVLGISMRQLQPDGGPQGLVPLPAAGAISLEEGALLRDFRELTLDDQECLLRVARAMASS